MVLEHSKEPLSRMDTSSSYRLSVVLLRVSLATNLLLLCVIGGGLCVIFSFLPLKTIQPVFIRLSDKSAQIIDIEVIRPTRTSQQAYREAMSRHFVMDHETITLVDDTQRLATLMDTFMEEDFANDFAKRMTLKSKDSPLKHAYEKGIQKTVEILISRPHPSAQDCIEVEWKVHFKHKKTSKILATKHCISIVQSHFREQITLTPQQMHANPLGLEITGYSTTEKDFSS